MPILKRGGFSKDLYKQVWGLVRGIIEPWGEAWARHGRMAHRKTAVAFEAVASWARDFVLRFGKKPQFLTFPHMDMQRGTSDSSDQAIGFR